jgi:hypothetical protein
MPSSLLPVGELISTGWDRFLADWKHNFELSIRFLFSSIVIFGTAFLTQNMPFTGQVILNVSAFLVASVINVHTMVTLTDFILRRDADPTKAATPSVEIGRKLFWPFAIVAAMQTLAVLGGLALFVIPGIWLSVLFSYSILALLEDNRRGTEALASSAELVKRHWWAVFGRSLVAGIIVGLLISVTTLIILLVVG